MTDNEVISIEDSNNSEYGTLSHEETDMVPFEDIPKYKASNPFNYDDETLARKNKEVLAIMRDYPNQSRVIIEEIWDITNRLNDEEWEEFKKKCKEPPMKRQPAFKPIEIIEPS